MGFLNVKNVAIKGISACIPKKVEENLTSSTFLSQKDAEKFIESTGIERHRIADKDVTASDLCIPAAEKLIKELKWEKKSIDCLIFVSQTPDYILPATSCIIQDRLGLSSECYSLDISLGCSGWVYGLSVISGLISNNGFKRGLLLCSDTLSKTNSQKDKTSWPLFSDAATITAIEFDENAKDIFFHFGTDGSSYQAIIIPDGGYRSMFNEKSLKYEKIDEGVIKNHLHGQMNGMDVFSFAITKVPKSINLLSQKYKLDLDNVDYYLFHQANLFLNETIRKKLKLSPEKVPYSLKNFGNTSGASIPLTIIDQLSNKIDNRHLIFIGCGFGVGLSWGSIYFETERIICPQIIEF